ARDGWSRSTQMDEVDVDVSEVVRGEIARKRPAERALSHERGARVLPGVPVKMEVQVACRFRRDIAPGDDFRSANGAARGIQSRVDGVVGVAGRERRGCRGCAG